MGDVILCCEYWIQVAVEYILLWFVTLYVICNGDVIFYCDCGGKKGGCFWDWGLWNVLF
jgi:hypothetical protein